METKIIELLSYTLPAVITGAVAYYFFNLHTKNDANRRKYLLNKQAQKNVLPLRLQAYERMVLFLERISLSNLLIRNRPITEDKNDYANFVIHQIEQEFEHNLAQQIYISDECWVMISTAKNATIQMIRKANIDEKIANADQLREIILKDVLENQSPSNAALVYLKKEVGNLW